MTTRCAFVVPGDIGLPTGGYAYDRHVLSRLAVHGVEARHVALPGDYPQPSPATLAATADSLAALPADTVLLIDGLAYGAMPESLVAAIRQPIVALVHHPLCLEAGLTRKRAHELEALETAALAHARSIVVTSATTRDTLVAGFRVAADRIVIAEPGTEPAPRAVGSAGPEVAILAVGSVVPRKGYDLLVEALGPLKSRPWTLTIAGATDRSAEALAAVEGAIARHGLGQRVRLAGAVDATTLDALYHHADLFVLASHYEGYGMVLTEAMARGLAIITTTGGAAASTVPDDAALKVTPGDARALMWLIGRALDEKALRRSLGEAALAAAANLPTWDDTARRVAGAIACAAEKETR